MRSEVVAADRVTSTRALVADETSHQQRDMCALLQTRLGPSAGPGVCGKLRTRVRIRRSTRAKADKFKREARECKAMRLLGKEE